MLTNRKLAGLVADAILNASGTTATRIALRQRYGKRNTFSADNERDLGGLCRAALVEVIHGALQAHAKEEP